MTSISTPSPVIVMEPWVLSTSSSPTCQGSHHPHIPLLTLTIPTLHSYKISLLVAEFPPSLAVTGNPHLPFRSST